MVIQNIFQYPYWMRFRVGARNDRCLDVGWLFRQFSHHSFNTVRQFFIG